MEMSGLVAEADLWDAELTSQTTCVSCAVSSQQCPTRGTLPGHQMCIVRDPGAELVEPFLSSQGRRSLENATLRISGPWCDGFFVRLIWVLINIKWANSWGASPKLGFSSPADQYVEPGQDGIAPFFHVPARMRTGRGTHAAWLPSNCAAMAARSIDMAAPLQGCERGARTA
jgi:hypothetical protein